MVIMRPFHPQVVSSHPKRNSEAPHPPDRMGPDLDHPHTLGFSQSKTFFQTPLVLHSQTDMLLVQQQENDTMNIQLAIAAMEQNNGQSATELLRDTYPELRFLFDQLDAANEVVEDTVPADDYADLERDFDNAQEELVEAQQLVQQMRDMANVLASMKRPTAADLAMLAEVGQ